MEKYEVTISYRAVITVSVKAESEKEAKEKGKEYFKKQKEKMFVNNNIALQDDTFAPQGVLNMDQSWNIL